MNVPPKYPWMYQHAAQSQILEPDIANCASLCMTQTLPFVIYDSQMTIVLHSAEHVPLHAAAFRLTTQTSLGVLNQARRSS